MKYVPWSDEEACGRATSYKRTGDFMCLRAAGHAGDCCAVAGTAAELDGVRHCCRVATGLPHHERCALLGDA